MAPRIRLPAALLALALQAGCEELQLPVPAGSAGSAGSAAQAGAATAASASGPATGAPSRSIPPRPPSRLSLDGVVIAGPEGYCIDRRASNANRAGFVLLASCAAISQSPEHPAPGRMGLLTATVGGPGSAAAPMDPALLAEYFRSPDGRATLSASGNPEAVSIVNTQQSGGAFYLTLLDRSPPNQPDLGPARWRALFHVEGRMVSAVLHSLKDEPIGKSAGLALLQDFVGRIRRQSGGAAATRHGLSPASAPLRD